MSEIHYFPRYSQQENFATNNTLLLLLRLYQYNRFKFEKFMETLCEEDDIQFTGSWLQFSQQTGTGRSVLDGYIAQDSIKIAVETKRGDKFDFSQLRNHLAVFGSEEHKLLILLSPSLDVASRSDLESLKEQARSSSIQVAHTSFERVVQAARGCLSVHEEEMHALVDDYESFCSDFGLLPRDRYTLFVPPCRLSENENLRLRLYYCPSAWGRRNAQYIGIYAAKTVKAIGRISKVVSCEVDIVSNSVDSAQITDEEKERILDAARSAQARNWNLSRDYKFYLCDEMVPTDFRKTSPGGIFGHRYFDLEEELARKVPNRLEELAELLRGRTWK